jgi:hypothetical protein
MSKSLYEEFSEYLKEYTDQKLVDRFNNETKGRGWASAKGIFLQALRNEMRSRGLDISSITNYSGGFSLKRKVTLVGKKIVPLDENG